MADLVACGLKPRRTSGPKDGAANAATRKQALICGVDDGVGVDARYVVANDAKGHGFSSGVGPCARSPSDERLPDR
jgi:hypothetical protein